MASCSNSPASSDSPSTSSPSHRDVVQEQQVSSTVVATGEFVSSNCNDIDIQSFQINSPAGCWTEHMYYNNDTEDVAIHFYPTTTSGFTITLIETQDRNVRLWNEMDLERAMTQALDLVNETLTAEEINDISARGLTIALERSKLTRQGAMVCMDFKGVAPIYGVVSICNTQDPLVAYYVKTH